MDCFSNRIINLSMTIAFILIVFGNSAWGNTTYCFGSVCSLSISEPEAAMKEAAGIVGSNLVYKDKEILNYYNRLNYEVKDIASYFLRVVTQENIPDYSNYGSANCATADVSIVKGQWDFSGWVSTDTNIISQKYEKEVNISVSYGLWSDWDNKCISKSFTKYLIHRKYNEYICDDGYAIDYAYGGEFDLPICKSEYKSALIEYPCKAPFAFDKEEGRCVAWCPMGASQLDYDIGRCKPTKTDECSVKVLNPINASDGEKIENFSPDYIGSGTYPLSLQRNYRSFRSPDAIKWPPEERQEDWVKYYQPANYEGGIRPNRLLREFESAIPATGYKQWKHNYDHELIIYDNQQKALLLRANDEEIYFTSVDGVTFQPEYPKGEQLVKSGSNFLYTKKSGSVETYDLDGHLIKITNVQGLSQNLNYDGKSRLLSVEDPANRKLLFNYDEIGRLISVINPSGQSINYSYDANGNLIELIHPDDTPGDELDNVKAVYNYEAAGLPYALTKHIDENGDIKGSWTYDSSGRATGSTNSGGHRSGSVAYESGKATVTEANGHSRTLTFDDKGRLASMTGGNCGQCSNSDVASYSYYSNNLLFEETDFNGVKTRYEYNSRGLQTKRTEAYGSALARITTTQWHDTLSLPVQVKTPTTQTDYVYGVRGRLESITETDLVNTENTARVTTYTYHESGLLASIDGPRMDVSDITSFTYDDKFDLVSVTDAVGNTTTITARNANGYPISITDPNGVVTTLRYDVRNRLISQDVAVNVTQFAYDNIGQLTKVTLPSGAVTEYTYNGARLLTQIADGLGNSINYTYDVMGNVTKVEVKDPEGTLHASQQQVFDDLNRVTSHIDGLNNTSTFSYDAVGNQTSVKSPALKETKQVYDALNRLSETTDAKAGKTTYGYDAANNLTLVKAPNAAQTTYQYDGFGNLLSQVSPDTGTTTFTYDVAGNQTSKTDGKNITVSYQYDALNRLTKIDYPNDNLDVTLTYDTGTNGKGRLSQITDGSGSTTYSYDALGNITSKTSTIAGKSFTLGYGYNGAGQLTQITQPSGRVVNLTRNSQGLVTGISETKNGNTQNLLTSAQYVPFGGAKSFTLGNGKTQTNTHNLNGQVASINVDEVYQSTLTYNADSQITALASSLASASNQSFSYDELDRLTEATGTYGTLAYSYDSASNRISKTTPSGTSTLDYVTNSNQLNNSFTHDANGNRTKDSTHTYTYGEHNRLTEVVNEKSGITTTYLYNGLGQRVKKSNVYGDVYFIYDEQGLLIAEANGLGKVTTEYIYFEGQPLVMLVGE